MTGVSTSQRFHRIDDSRLGVRPSAWRKEPVQRRLRLSRRMSARTKSAVVVALVVVGAACSGGGGHHAAAPSTSTTTARRVVASHPSALGFLSAPYITATSGGATHVAVVWDWNGKRHAGVHTGPAVDCCTTVSLSPDGTRLRILYPPRGEEIVDLYGNVIFKSPDLVGSWADDSRHQCTLQPHPSQGHGSDDPTDLVVIDPNGTRHVVGAVGYASTLLRCSISADQAIVAGSAGAGVVGPVSQVQLSTGRVSTPTWLHSTQELSGLVVSGSGTVAAVSQFGNQPTQTTIIDMTTGKVVGRVTGSPMAISWNGHVVVERRNQDIAVVDWQSGAVTWHTRPGGANPNVFVAARQRSDDLALAAINQLGQASDQAALWLIAATGRARLLDDHVLFGII
jgi:hypothetical protein